jgi:hypothetical protein
MDNKVNTLLHKIVGKQGQFSAVDSDLITVINTRTNVFNKYYNSLKKHNLYYIIIILGL